MVNIIFADRFQDPYDQFQGCKVFSLKEIKAATQDFNSANIIGKYGYYGGLVYKGVLPDNIPIQVTQIPTVNKAVVEEYVNNIAICSQLRHQNIIRLLGVHLEHEEYMLAVYEHMDNGDLYHTLHGDGNLKKRLNWKTRIEICLGIAKGLAFLHHKDKSKPLIVHRHIKPINIFLDKFLNPKISNFDSARIFSGEDTHYSTVVCGTMGYFEPEYFSTGTINDKTDVYSFGVVVLEVLSGKKQSAGLDGSKPFSLVPYAYGLQEKGDLIALVDDDVKTSFALKEATMILNLAMSCIHSPRKLRPTMSEVVDILEGRTTMKTPVVDPLSSEAVNSEVVISIVESNSTSKQTEVTNKDCVSNLDYVSDDIVEEESPSSEIPLEVVNNNHNLEHLEYAESSYKGHETGSLTFRSIEVATKSFSLANKIGQGSTGSVYRGILPNGKIVAVKQLLIKSDQGKQDFLNEVNIISSLKHPNLVRLLWHCTGNNQHCLVYEYMENGSLYRALFDNVKEKLSWPARVQICIGVAKGLSFLHEDDSKNKIVHRDIKLSNILLDKDLNPKICDFGLAMHYKREIEHINTGLAGTIGYMAPEYVNQGTVTEKIDAYSFGIVTLELITGKKKVQWMSGHESVSLRDLVSDLLQKGDILGLVDQDLKTTIPVNEAELMLSLAMLCTNPDPKSRPTMSEVVSILEGKTMIKISTSCNLHDQTRIDHTIDSTATSFIDLTASTSTHHGNVKSSSDMYHHNDWVPTVLSTNVGSEEKKYKNDAESHPDFVSDGRLSVNKVRLNCISVDEATVEPELPHSKYTPIQMEYKYVEPSLTEDGKLQIMCTDEEFEAGCKEWKNSLVGFFVGENVHFDVDIKMVRKVWEVKGDLSVFSMDNGYFIFQFGLIEDKIRVVQSADLWQIQQRPMILRQWDWKLKINGTEIESLPIWVKIYNLPLFLWTPSFLSKIGSGLGIPLFADLRTESRKRLAYAMLCVEVNSRKLLPESLNIIVKGMEYELKLEYDSSQIAALFDRKT